MRFELSEVARIVMSTPLPATVCAHTGVSTFATVGRVHLISLRPGSARSFTHQHAHHHNFCRHAPCRWGENSFLWAWHVFQEMQVARVPSRGRLA